MVKRYGAFHEIDLGSVRPAGWLRNYLEMQRDGLTGHIWAAGTPFDAEWWGTEKADSWCPYEQTGYWVDGAVRCGHLIGDTALVAKAARQIEAVIAGADPDGYLGPALLKGGEVINRWPHAVFFRALMAHQAATGDARIVEALRRHYLSNTRSHAGGREVCNVEPMLWTYGRTGDDRLLTLALQAYAEYNRLSAGADTSVEAMLSDKRATEHGVTYNEIAKLGAVIHLYTGHEPYLAASVNAYRKLDRDQMLIDGVPSSSENLAGRDPLDSHETCDIADYTWSAGYLLMATGRAEYGDKIERACFNAAPGAVTGDFRALQYFSCPNQVIADRTSNHNLFFRGSKWMSYRPNPGTECCPGNVNRAMPNFAARMWMLDNAGGLAAVLYGPSRLRARLGREGTTVAISEETDYPFDEEIQFSIKTETPVVFPFSFRIPGWCRDARLAINGEPMAGGLRAGTLATIHRAFRDNDRISLTLPMEIKLSHWPGGGVGLERGPLVYALGIEEDWQEDEDRRCTTPGFPAWNLYPASPWAYALGLAERNLGAAVEVIRRPMASNPWSLANAPIALRVPARRVRGWDIVRRGMVQSFCLDQHGTESQMLQREINGNFAFTPPLITPNKLGGLLGDEAETVTFVPYGCAKLRLAILPWARPGDRSR